MGKYTNEQIYNAIIDYGIDNFIELCIGENQYYKLIKEGSFILEYRHWGTRLPNIRFEDAIKEIKDLNNRNNAAVNIYFKPYSPYERAWFGYEYRFDEIAQILLNFTFEEKMEIIHKYKSSPIYFSKNITKDYKFDTWLSLEAKIHLTPPRDKIGFLYHFKTLGFIKLGSIYAIINDDIKIKLPLNFDEEGFNGTIETKYPINKIIFTVEKDGLILDEHNLIEQQNIKNFEESVFDHSNKICFNFYSVPLSASEISGEYACERDSFEAMQKLEKVLEYKKLNQEQGTELLELAIELVRDYTGFLGGKK